MLSPLDLSFWQAALPPICVLALPIAIVTGSSILRSVAAAAIVYFLIVIVNINHIAPL